MILFNNLYENKIILDTRGHKNYCYSTKTTIYKISVDIKKHNQYTTYQQLNIKHTYPASKMSTMSKQKHISLL